MNIKNGDWQYQAQQQIQKDIVRAARQHQLASEMRHKTIVAQSTRNLPYKKVLSAASGVIQRLSNRQTVDFDATQELITIK
ncbi:MAG: hypothetical protein H7Y09_09325 [Chitinophagaceae bacterium]|nr:hypothetical protein [Anaerolineae bacterium]